jgi:hypothetical protein
MRSASLGSQHGPLLGSALSCLHSALWPGSATQVVQPPPPQFAAGRAIPAVVAVHQLGGNSQMWLCPRVDPDAAQVVDSQRAGSTARLRAALLVRARRERQSPSGPSEVLPRNYNAIIRRTSYQIGHKRSAASGNDVHHAIEEHVIDPRRRCVGARRDEYGLAARTTAGKDGLAPWLAIQESGRPGALGAAAPAAPRGGRSAN